MPQSLAKIHLHIVFSTKHRYPFLSSDPFRAEMHSYLGGTCNALDCQAITVGGSSDHVHLLCMLSKNLSAVQLVGEIKRRSSKWAKTKASMTGKFSWQNGYGVFSIGQSHIETVQSYILDQLKHHQKKSFQEEYLDILKSHRVKYDERFLWD